MGTHGQAVRLPRSTTEVMIRPIMSFFRLGASWGLDLIWVQAGLTIGCHHFPFLLHEKRMFFFLA
jgi:hypothetical protein